MDFEPATPQSETIASVRPDVEIVWDQQPEQLTTREVASLFGKSAANIRARASRGDFGNTVTGDDGLPRYDRSRVRALYERVTQREAQSRAVTNLHSVAGPSYSTSLSPVVTTAIAEIQAQHREQVALWSARFEDSQQAAQRAHEETQSLRELLREREETTRATLSHMDMLYAESLTQLRQTLSQEQAHKAELIAAKDSEISRLRSVESSQQNRGSFWHRLFGG
ncbi:MAG: hypothetical protein ACRYFS_23340 [Janthinobacterium lividum]